MLLGNTLLLFIRTLLNVLLTLALTRWLIQGLGEEGFGTFMGLVALSLVGRPLAASLTYAAFRNIALALGGISPDRCHADAKERFAEATMLAAGASTGVLIVILMLLGPLSSSVGLGTVKPYDAKILLVALSVANVSGMVVSGPYRAALNAREQFLPLVVWEVGQTAILAGFAFATQVGILSILGLGVGYSVTLTVWNLLGMIVTRILVPWARARVNGDWRGAIRRHEVAAWHLLQEGAIWMRLSLGVVLAGQYYGPIAAGSFAVGARVDDGVDRLSRPVADAVRPRLVKAVGASDETQTHDITMVMARVGALTCLAGLLPFVMNGRELLQLWLGVVPEGTVGIVTVMAATRAIQSLSLPYLHIAAARDRLRPLVVLNAGMYAAAALLALGGFHFRFGGLLAYPVSFLVVVGVLSVVIIPALVSRDARMPLAAFYHGVGRLALAFGLAVAMGPLVAAVLPLRGLTNWAGVVAGLTVLGLASWLIVFRDHERRLLLAQLGRLLAR